MWKRRSEKTDKLVMINLELCWTSWKRQRIKIIGIATIKKTQKHIVNIYTFASNLYLSSFPHNLLLQHPSYLHPSNHSTFSSDTVIICKWEGTCCLISYLFVFQWTPFHICHPTLFCHLLYPLLCLWPLSITMHFLSFSPNLSMVHIYYSLTNLSIQPSSILSYSSFIHLVPEVVLTPHLYLHHSFPFFFLAGKPM